jgi:ribosomal protein L17
MKLTRKAIREGLDQLPIDSILLGAAGAKVSKLTAKQKAFAREVALGETKAGAYRKAYKTNAKPQTQSQEGTRLMNDPKIAAYTEAINRALEVQRLQTPAQLRALVVSELTKHAIDEDLPAAQRLRALQLLGTVTEVAAFTERREVIKTTNSEDARAQLMDSLMLAIKQGATDVDDSAAADLLAELNAGSDADTIEADATEQGQGFDNPPAETPPTPDPLESTHDTAGHIHSIPLTRSP